MSLTEKSFTVEWLSPALDDLAEIISFYSENRASSLVDEIDNSVSLLADNPFMGKSCKIKDIRIIITKSKYVIAYSVDNYTVNIRSIIYSVSNHIY